MKTEDIGIAELPSPISGNASTPTQLLRDRLAVFKFDDVSTLSLRRSPRNHSAPKFEESESSLPTVPGGSCSPKKRSATAVDHGPDKKAKLEGRKTPKTKRGIAPPEKYAYLAPLSDHLGEDADLLDIMFCGINPGKMSATLGHHFAHPTNHFWKCLYGSQLTDRLLSPSEDHTLPGSYRLGLTNLVERPSAEAAELAGSEFTAGVPALLRKIVRHRPRFVCFVGKQIWESFIKAAAPPSSRPFTPSDVPATPVVEHTEETVTAVAEGSVAVTKKRKKEVVQREPAKRQPKGQPKFTAYDLQPYKVVHSDPNAGVRETLFFVVVSTSGLVAGYQLKQKIEQFALLKQRLDELERGELDTSAMTTIPVPTTLLS
ncbi:DNA glycosylase [Trametes cingulata]|nr:DNA glycosylase [Trametes cingulata]